jgi:hypothetical protein
LESPSTLFKDDFEVEDFPTASSTVIHPETSLDDGCSHTAITTSTDKGIAGSSSNVADTTEERVKHSQKSRKHVDDEQIVVDTTEERVKHSQKSRKHVDDEQIDEQFEGSQEKVVVPLKTTDVRPVTEPEDNGEGGSNLQKNFRLAGASNKGTSAVRIIIGCQLCILSSHVDMGSPTIVKMEKVAEQDNEGMHFQLSIISFLDL